jgi:hypothetical protein
MITSLLMFNSIILKYENNEAPFSQKLGASSAVHVIMMTISPGNYLHHSDINFKGIITVRIN